MLYELTLFYSNLSFIRSWSNTVIFPIFSIFPRERNSIPANRIPSLIFTMVISCRAASLIMVSYKPRASSMCHRIKRRWCIISIDPNSLYVPTEFWSIIESRIFISEIKCCKFDFANVVVVKFARKHKVYKLCQRFHAVGKKRAFYCKVWPTFGRRFFSRRR